MFEIFLIFYKWIIKKFYCKKEKFIGVPMEEKKSEIILTEDIFLSTEKQILEEDTLREKSKEKNIEEKILEKELLSKEKKRILIDRESIEDNNDIKRDFGIKYVNDRDKYRIIGFMNSKKYNVVSFDYNDKIIWFSCKENKEKPKEYIEANIYDNEKIIEVLNEEYSSKINELKNNDYRIIATKREKRHIKIWFY